MASKPATAANCRRVRKWPTTLPRLSITGWAASRPRRRPGDPPSTTATATPRPTVAKGVRHGGLALGRVPAVHDRRGHPLCQCLPDLGAAALKVALASDSRLAAHGHMRGTMD